MRITWLLFFSVAILAATAEEAPPRVHAASAFVALTRGDTAPLAAMLHSGTLLDSLIADYVARGWITSAERGEVYARLDENVAQSLSAWSRVFAGAELHVGEPTEASGELRVTARLETGRMRQFFRFVFKRDEGEWRLAEIELPMLGQTLSDLLSRPLEPRLLARARPRTSGALRGVAWTLGVLGLVGGLVLALLAARRGRRLRPGLAVIAASLLFGAVGFLLPSRSEGVGDAALREDRLGQIASVAAGGAATQGEEMAREFLVRWPGEPTARMLLGAALFRQEKWEDADAVYAELLAEGHYPELAHNQRAVIAERQGDYASATEHLRAVVEALGLDDALLVELGNSQLLAGELPSASATFTQALDVNPGSLLARELRARTAMRQGDLSAARRDLAALQRLDPQLDESALSGDEEFAPLFRE